MSNKSKDLRKCVYKHLICTYTALLIRCHLDLSLLSFIFIIYRISKICEHIFNIDTY